VLLRVAVVLVFVGLAAYVSLPWWLPKDMIRRHIAADISRQTGLDVQIDSLSIGWKDGVDIRGLKISSPTAAGGADFDSGTMIEIPHLRCDFSPLKLVLRRKIEWMEVDSPHISVRVDREGNLNIAPLKNLALDIDISRVSVRRATVTIQPPDHDRKLAVHVADLQFHQGRMENLGHISMTAALAQTGGAAPISLRVSGEPQHDQAGHAQFYFANIDLGQLPLPQLFGRGFPIRSLKGRCRGQLAFGINANLEVDQLNLELIARKLEVHPAGTEVLPVIDEAGLRMSATLDAFSQRVDIQSLQVRLPGVELAGRASVYADILTGSPEAVHYAELRGILHPEQIAAVLTGRKQTTDTLNIEGGIEFDARVYARPQQQFDVRLSVRADRAEVRLNQGVPKPAGQKLRFNLAGRLLQGQERFLLDRCRLTWGANHFTAAGAIAAAPRNYDENPSPWRLAAEAMKGVDLRGTIEMVEMHSLGQAAPGGKFQPLKLEGGLTGIWSIEAGPQPRISASLRANTENQFVIEPLLTKPPHQDLTLDFNATIDPAKMRVHNILLDVLAGGTEFSLDKTVVQLPVADSPAGQISGTFQVEEIRKLAICFPALEPLGLSGTVRGSFHGPLDCQVPGIAIEADLNTLNVAAENAFVKPAGRPASLTTRISIETDRDKTASIPQILIEWTSPDISAQAGANLVYGKLRPRNAYFKADIQDAAALAEACPALREALRGGRLGGSIALDGQVRFNGRQKDFSLGWEAKNLICVVGGKDKLLNIQDKPVGGKLWGRVTEKPDGGVLMERIYLHASLADVAFIKGYFSGELCGASSTNRKVTKDASNLTRGIRRFSATFDIYSDVGSSLAEVVPPLAPTISKHGLSGRVCLGVVAALAGDTMTLTGRLANSKRVVVKDFAGLSKPADMPLRLNWMLTAPRDLSTITLDEFTARLGKIQLEMSASAKPRLDETTSLPTEIASAEGSASLQVTDAKTLGLLLPNDRLQRAGGEGRLDVRWALKDDKSTATAKWSARNLHGIYRDKQVVLDGELKLEEIHLTRDRTKTPRWKLDQVGRIFTDNMEFRAGRNHGWLLADLKPVPGKLSGKFHALFDFVDTRDLFHWLARPKPDPVGEFTEKELVELNDRVDTTIAELRRWAKSADLHGRVSARKCRVFDSKVKQYYLANALELAVSIDYGRIGIEFDTGLNGGTMRGQLDTRLTDKQPVFTSETNIFEILATPAIRPQISMDFPGNTVMGLFTRREKVSCPLRDMTANAIDPRFRYIPVGEAKMIATNGVLVGKSAPDFVTKIFPGLNLMEYKYNKMTGFSSYLANGTVENEMIFNGPYDVYLEGKTDRDYNIKYTLGLVFLGTVIPADVHHDWKQGRIPILKVKGRIENGELVDDVVSYPWPNETIFEIFLKNNIFYRAWLNAEKKKQNNNGDKDKP